MNNNKKTNLLTKTLAWLSIAIGGTVCIIATVFVMSVINAFVFSAVWNWYVVPFFHQPPLPLVTAFGIGLLFATLRGWQSFEKHKSNTNISEAIATVLVFPAVILLMGWIGTWFV